jgi:hypothetical protein
MKTLNTLSPIIKDERQGKMLGVKGRFTAVTIGGKNYRPGTFTSQKFITAARPFKGPHAQKGEIIQAEIRFDDSCRNGRNSFAITGETRVPGRSDIEMGGCIHDEIAAHFPELAPLIKWHLTNANGPMHYIANTIYLAGDRDHNGKKAGEPCAWSEAVQFGSNPVKHKVGRKFWQFLKDAAPHNGRAAYDFEVLPFYHDDNGKPGKYQFGPKYTFGGFADKWHECPFDTEGAAIDFLGALQTCEPKFVQTPTLFSEGKARQLDAARNAAVWPDATDAELMQEPEALKAALLARHGDLMAAFRAAIDATGFLWAPDTDL